MGIPLKYHQQILHLLGIEPVLPFERAALLEERERLCGVRFPASVREWFAVQHAEALFHHNTNEDHLEELAKLGSPDETAQGSLRVATENQAVVAWYVRLADGDDPPVYDNNDEWNKDLSKTNWHLCSATFTNFIFDVTSTHHFGGWYSGMHLSANDSLPDEATRALLGRWFQQGPTTDTPLGKVYRFFTTEGILAIRSVTEEHLAHESAEWIIDAASPEAVLDFGRKLWGVGTLSHTLRAKSSSLQSRAKGEELLQRLRSEHTA
jgi:hypothetical protein